MSLIVLFPAIPISLLPIAAFTGALIAALTVYGLSWNDGSSPIRLILVGVGVGAIVRSIAFPVDNDNEHGLQWL